MTNYSACFDKILFSIGKYIIICTTEVLDISKQISCIHDADEPGNIEQSVKNSVEYTGH